ncbi:phosphate transport system permease protein PstA [Chroococcidiopsis cubana SAG 39.79]|uniref:Phosphate transport system permease protein PstA n=1 Tax=Chroococcidiopsis cubana SAG 39.79 TaxID=388085 RepID=A0AB37UFJ0_9CYAN|nr:phosphate ABC transporter permease PstA [Chroococcidiopsis cubana]PSB61937.1 phosphate ABC transporter permease PtsA [Chroococcidiopsis cubana CCALA 043]RUT10370.1 phosphate transport system permease protein PstA [Chroococcidiopsis cubana SAG 39.79]
MATSFYSDSDREQAEEFNPQLEKREIIGKIFEILCLIGLSISLIVLMLLFFDILRDGIGTLLRPGFLTETPSRFANRGGIRPAIIGSIFLGILVILIAVPIGVGTALYLEEYAPKAWWTDIVEINIANLAGVPSIVYGLLGLGVFYYMLGFGPSLITGALTLSLETLPIIIVTSREAIRAVPNALREASYGLGTTKWQTIWNHVLPYAVPGILTGVILAVSRAIGDAAALLVIGAVSFLTFNPGLFQRFMALPIQIFSYITRPEPGFADAAAATIIVILFVVLVLNGVAIYLRNRFSLLK